MTLKMDPHRQPRNDRLRRDPDVLPFSTLITIILRRLASRPQNSLWKTVSLQLPADKDVSELAVNASINSPQGGRLLTDGGVCAAWGQSLSEHLPTCLAPFAPPSRSSSAIVTIRHMKMSITSWGGAGEMDRGDDHSE